MQKLTDKQTTTLLLLKEVIAIFRKENIPFSLAFGSVLGAIRHKGYIPWDQDIDLYIDMDHYDLACRKLQEQLPDELQLFAKEVDPTYEEVVVRVGFKGQPHQKIHIDLFLLTGCPEASQRVSRRIFKLVTYLANRCYFIKKVKPSFNYPHKPKKKFAAYVCKAILLPIPAGVFKSIFNWYARRYPIATSSQLCSICGYYSIDYWDKAWWTEQIHYPFEDMHVPIPKDWDAYLKHHYGDYMTPVKY